MESHAGMRSCHGRRRSFTVALVALGLALAPSAFAQPLQDNFTNRLTLTNLTGQFYQNNSNATIEAGEPRHGGKIGGHSLWLSWIAASNGIVSFKTETSGFDTLLSAYQFITNGNPTFANLREVARADDSEGLEHESEVDFAVRAGEQYEIAVDGYYGAVGIVDFQWEFRPLTNDPPQILNTIPDQAANLGDVVTLAFNVTNALNGTYKWYQDNVEISKATNITLVVSNFSAANVGRYKMRTLVRNSGGEGYYSVPVELQINTEGLVDALAQPKVLDSPTTPLIGNPPVGSRPGLRNSSGVVSGYNGSQIFNTTYALTDTNEPVHCSTPSGKSYWLSYLPPTNGTITLDTIGSSYDTVMEAYTYNGTLTNYAGLIPLDCANDSFSSNNAARVVVPVAKARRYLFVVAGVNGASGTAFVNYSLNTNQLPQPPTLTSTPPPQTVAAGATILLTAPVSGAPPLVYAWRKDGVLLTNQTSPALLLSQLGAAHSGNYTFTVTNDMGSVTGTFALKVVVPPQMTLVPIATGMQIRFLALGGQVYTIEETTNFPGPWTPWPGGFVGNGLTNYFNVANSGNKFYRIRVE